MRKDRVVLITGASRGLGRETARLFAARGARLILTARGAEGLLETVASARAHTDVVAPAGDIAHSEHAERLVALGLARFGRIDVLINNASSLGPTPMPPLEALSLEAFDAVIHANVTTPLHLVQLVLPGMKAWGEGVIVNVTSDAGVQAYAGWGGYGVSKAALEHLSRILAEEVSGTGVRVYVADPGNMNTVMHREAEPGADLSDLPGPEKVAPALVRLIEEETVPFRRVELQAWGAGVGEAARR